MFKEKTTMSFWKPASGIDPLLIIALCCNTTCWISPPPRWRVPSRRSCFPNLRPKGHHPSFSRKCMKEIWDYSPTCNPVTFIADDWFISLLLIVFAGFMHIIPSSGGPSKWVPPGPILSQVLGKQGLDRVLFFLMRLHVRRTRKKLVYIIRLW